jgi:hypothetical protein
MPAIDGHASVAEDAGAGAAPRATSRAPALLTAVERGSWHQAVRGRGWGWYRHSFRVEAEPTARGGGGE